MAVQRQVSITTPLSGEEELLFVSAKITEQLGQMFRGVVTLYSESDSINANDILGQNVTINLELGDGEARSLNGYVSRFSQLGNSVRGFSVYQIVVHPWLWFLTRTSDCRIFQNMTVPDIIKEVFSDNGFSDFEEKTNATYREWEYCVQYRETDYNFVNRLMQGEGIYFCFKHEEDKHILVLCDGASSHEDVEGESSLEYHATGHNVVAENHFVTNWTIANEIQPEEVSLTDFDPLKPKSNLLSSGVIPNDHPGGDRKVFDYPGEYVTTGEGSDLARARIEELHVDAQKTAGLTDHRQMKPGVTFTLKEHPRDDQNKKYLVIATSIELHSNEYASGNTAQEPYQCNVVCIDSETVFRTARDAPKPVVQGIQTAIVVGPSGEEIYPDKYGRIKCQFHWDRYGTSDENSSCWIRVAQTWAGGGWGSQYIPRVGQEVIVEFLEGDPDRPLCTGCVPNADHMPPYELPANKTQSGFKTRTSPSGKSGVKDANEIRFEDKAGEEFVFLNSNKDMHVRTKEKKFENILDEDHLTVVKDQFTKLDADQHLTIAGDQNEDVTGTVSLKTGADLQQKVGGKAALDATGEIHIKSGMKVIIEAGTQISLKASGSFVDIGPSGVSIKGAMVLINSGGSAGSGSGASPDTPKEPEDAMEVDESSREEPEDKSIVKATVGALPTGGGAAQAAALRSAAQSGAPFCEKCEAARQAAANA